MAIANMSARTRSGILAIVLLAVLLAGTAVAWVLSSRSVSAVPGEQWYLITGPDNKPVGWAVTYRGQGGKLGLEGYQVVREPGGQLAARWELNPTGTLGRYMSYIATIGSGGQERPQRTSIDYNGKAVAVGRPPAPQRILIPVNQRYVPEGRLEPRIVEAARSGESFVGTLVQDSTLSLGVVELGPKGEQTRPVAGKQMTLQVVEVAFGSSPDDMALSRRYYVAQDGTIPLIEDVPANTVWTLAGDQVVTQHFPDALADKVRILHQIQMPG